MQQKGERENMTNGECCRYIRTYSELEGLQHACTLVYCAASTPQGVLAQLRREQGGKVRSSTVLAPADSFGRVMRLLRYLCENGVGPEQWLEVLEDVHQALPAAGYFEKRNKYSRRTGFLWHLSVLRAQTSAILRN